MTFEVGLLDRLAAAKLWLISERRPGAADGPRDLPYLAVALYALVPVPCTGVPTMTVDEQWRVYVNPEWLATAEVPEIAAELAHLVWHLLHDHAGRARDLRVDATSAAAWHTAADAAVSQTLGEDRLVPAGMTGPEALRLPRGWSAEQYFAALSRLPAGGGGDDGAPAEPGCGSGCDGLPRGFELPPDLDSTGQVDRLGASEIRRRVAIQYREHVTGRGLRPGNAWRWSEQILEPRIAWEPLLSRAVRRAVGWRNGDTEYTYRRRSRRAAAAPRVVLPGTHRPVPGVAMVIDTSGSVDDDLLGRALGEVDGALRGLGVSGTSVTVLACDAAVHAVTRVRRARDAALAGGGGTDLREGIGAAAALRPRPEIVVVFTDGYTPWPETPPPGSAVIAALLARDGQPLPPTPPWVARVECRL
jgi:predicted metal-dependent peptidase